MAATTQRIKKGNMIVMKLTCRRMLVTVTLCSILTAGGITKASRIFSFAGPYVTYAERFYRCPGVDYSGHVSIMFLRPSYFKPHFTTPQTITGNVTAKEALGDNVWAAVTIDKWNNNEWKENYFVAKFPRFSCSNLRRHIPNFWKLIENNGNQKQTCRINKGVRIFNNTPINWTFPHFPVMPYGRWRFRLTFGFEGSNETRFCHASDTVTAPNPRA